MNIYAEETERLLYGKDIFDQNMWQARESEKNLPIT